jgi:hypothetical protein
VSDSGSDMSSGIGFWMDWDYWYSIFPILFLEWWDYNDWYSIASDSDEIWVSTILGYLSIDGVIF